MTRREIRPQPGPQTLFLASSADIVIYGGAAGGGKTWGILLEPLRHIHNKTFAAAIFRRTSVQIRNPGALWDQSQRLYHYARGRPQLTPVPTWFFPSGSQISFNHLEHDKNVHDYQGAEIPFIGFDELTHFSEEQFWYMVSRNRSTCGVRPYIRATCNPDCDSWVAQFIAWWIDPDTGYPIPERAGIIRWFVRVGDKLIWGESPESLSGYVSPLDGEPIQPKSVTFIPSRLSDNQVLMKADPGYLANLMALPMVERERLLNGNWKIRWQGQRFFDTAHLLVNGMPVPFPCHCDAVYGIMDTASKSGTDHDGSAVGFFAFNQHAEWPVTILDWDLTQIDSDLLINWLPSLFTVGEALARETQARVGFVGIWIEDKASGMVLLQQGQRRGLNVKPIESKLTSLGKDERALSVSGYVSTGQVKISDRAWAKTVIYKEVSRNHFISQIENFTIGDKDESKRADDCLDVFTYGTALGCGNQEGF